MICLAACNIFTMVPVSSLSPQDWRPKFNRANQFLIGQTAADIIFFSDNELKRLRRGNVLQCPGFFRCTLVAVEGCSERSECCKGDVCAPPSAGCCLLITLFESGSRARTNGKKGNLTNIRTRKGGEPGNRDIFQSLV